MMLPSRLTCVVLALFAFVPAMARAQDFGVLESAEIIDRGNFKARVNPMLIFGKNGQDDSLGVAAVIGYGFTPRFDAEGGVAFYEGSTVFGGNGEVSVVKSTSFHFSVIGGLHARRGDRTADEIGVDLTFLPTAHVSPRLDITVAIDMAFESFPESRGGGSYKTVHLAPGLEFKLRQDLDFVAELGLAMNDTASHYLAGGLAFYLR